MNLFSLALIIYVLVMYLFYSKNFNIADKNANVKTLKAFSIAELSVVIVASGLLLFAGFKGFDLVKKAKVNSLINQISEIRTALDVFNDTNGGLPGDVAIKKIADFANTSDATKAIDISSDAGFAANGGNGNGAIAWGSDASGCLSDSTFLNESTAAWYQLFYANYINNSGIVSNNPSLYSVVTDVTSSNVLPKTKTKGLSLSFMNSASPSIGSNAATTLFASNSTTSLGYNGNVLLIGGVEAVNSPATCSPSSVPSVSVLSQKESLMLDQSIDDGIANSGNVTFCDVSVDAATGIFNCQSTEGTFATVSVKIIKRS